MTAESGNGGPPEAPPRRPRIIIEFDHRDSTECKIASDPDVTTGQLYLAAWLLDHFAGETRVGERAMLAAQAGKIALPASREVGGLARRS